MPVAEEKIKMDDALAGIKENAPGPQAESDLELWDVAHITIREIRAATGLSQVAFAQRFCIPRRTVENWESGASTCPDYLRILLAQAVGLYTRS